MNRDDTNWKVDLRRAVLADVPVIARLAADLVRGHHAMDPARFMRIEPVEEGYAWYLGTQVDLADVVLLVAELEEGGGKRVVGYALGALEERDWMNLLDACGKIHDLYVEEGLRGRGLGSLLLEEAASRLEALGAPRVVLSTAWRNDGARRFFESAGFRPTMVELTREARPSR